MSKETIDLIQNIRKNKEKDLISILKDASGKHSPPEINHIAKKTLRDYAKNSGNHIDYFDEYEKIIQNLYGNKLGVCLNDIILAEAEAILITLSQTKSRLKETNE